jgi:hypothetical protein
MVESLTLVTAKETGFAFSAKLASLKDLKNDKNKQSIN